MGWSTTPAAPTRKTGPAWKTTPTPSARTTGRGWFTQAFIEKVTELTATGVFTANVATNYPYTTPGFAAGGALSAVIRPKRAITAAFTATGSNESRIATVRYITVNFTASTTDYGTSINDGLSAIVIGGAPVPDDGLSGIITGGNVDGLSAIVSGGTAVVPTPFAMFPFTEGTGATTASTVGGWTLTPTAPATAWQGQAAKDEFTGVVGSGVATNWSVMFDLQLNTAPAGRRSSKCSSRERTPPPSGSTAPGRTSGTTHPLPAGSTRRPA